MTVIDKWFRFIFGQVTKVLKVEVDAESAFCTFIPCSHLGPIEANNRAFLVDNLSGDPPPEQRRT